MRPSLPVAPWSINAYDMLASTLSEEFGRILHEHLKRGWVEGITGPMVEEEFYEAAFCHAVEEYMPVEAAYGMAAYALRSTTITCPTLGNCHDRTSPGEAVNSYDILADRVYKAFIRIPTAEFYDVAACCATEERVPTVAAYGMAAYAVNVMKSCELLEAAP